MNAAIVRQVGSAPEFGEFREPVAEAEESIVSMSAAALSNLTRGRAEGTHYSSESTENFVPGVDGVGRTAEGRRVYLALPRAPFGTMAERCPMRTSMLVPVPDELPDTLAAALANPGMSSWAALHDRARFVAGECVLVNGATGISGGLAVRIAKHLGARRVIATGRDVAVLEELRGVGADAVVNLREEPEALRRQLRAKFEEGVDVVLDYLWGPAAELLLECVPDHGSPRESDPLRFVQIGSMAGRAIPMHAAVLRRCGLMLMGSGIGSVSTKRLLEGVGEMFKLAVPAGLTVDFVERPLQEVTAAWKDTGASARVVFTL